jgi:CDP-diacylglycerol pyrophosphatase
MIATLRSAALLIGASVAALAAIESHAENRDALRQIVQDRCVVHWLQQEDPAPCARVHLRDAQHGGDGYAVLADIKGGAHFLLIPTQTIAGIESPAILKPQAPNYFAGAWEARDRLAAVLGHAVRRDHVGLAVNSRQHRSQDQLHIHIECLGPEVYSALHAAADRLNGGWSTINLERGQYLGMRVTGEDLGKVNPFALLSERLPGAREQMGAYTLMVAGMQFKDGPGFIVLTGKNVPGTEVLLDSTCAVAQH